MRKKLLLLASVLCLAMGCGGELGADDSEVSNRVSETVDNEKSGDDFFKDDEEREKPKEKPKATVTPTPEPVDENVITIEGKGFMPMEYVSTMYKEGELVNVIVGEGIENIYFGGCKSLEKVKLPSSMTYIGMETFCNCESLVKVGIPETVTAIYDYAFSGCTSLETIELPKSITQISMEAFSGCAKLKEIIIPNGVSSIGQGCFIDCWSLTEITIPEGVTSIEYETFAGCIGLKEVTIPSSVTYIDENAFVGCNEIKFNYESGSYVEQWLVSTGRLKAYTIDGNTVTFHAISDTFTGSYAEEAIEAAEHNFYEGVTVIFEEGIKHISDGVFFDRTTSSYDYFPYIKKIILPNSLETIGHNAFKACSLDELTIPDSVNYIGYSAFLDSYYDIHNDIWVECKINYSPASYTELWLIENEYIDGEPHAKYTIDGDTITFHAVLDYLYPLDFWDYDYDTVYNVIIEEGIKSIPASYGFVDDDSVFKVSSVKLPSTLEYIAEYTFSGRKQLTELTIPGSIKNFDELKFSYCTALEEITILEGITSIGEYSFQDCSALTRVILPESVTHIENNAFSGCTALTDITLPSNLEYIGDNALDNCALTSINLPDGLKSIGINGISRNKNTELIVPGSIEYLDDCAVSSHSLEKLVFKEGITVIGYQAARDCINLKELYLPDSLLTIEDFAFINCWALKKIGIPDGVTYIGNSAFSYNYSGEDYVSLEEVTIPASVTYMGEYVFGNPARSIKFNYEKGSYAETYLRDNGYIN